MDRRAHYLHAGHLHVSTDPCAITTILGSCVAVCLWDERIAIGGMNHFLLPHRITADHAPARFGTLATAVLIDKLLALGAQAANLRAKVFGGASLLVPGGSSMAVGTRNAEVAIDILRERGVPVLAASLGGTRGRKLIFHTDSGEAFEKVI